MHNTLPSTPCHHMTTTLFKGWKKKSYIYICCNKLAQRGNIYN